MFRIPSERLNPSAPPPAAPPPPLPPQEEAPPNRSSYQQQYVTSNINGAGGIQNYATTGYTTSQWKGVADKTYGGSGGGSRGLSTSSVEAGYGDVTINPNTGQLNSAFGDSLQEATVKLRFLNLGACALAMLWSVPNILGQIAGLHFAKAVLAGYLTFFSMLVFLFALHNKWIEEHLRDQFGMLYHPLGRSFLLLLMGGMAIGQLNLIDWVIGGIFVVDALVTTFCFIRYPEYRRMFEDDQSDLLKVAKESATQYAWANPDKVANVFGSSNSEQSSLLSAMNGT